MASVQSQILDEYEPEAILSAAIRLQEGPVRRRNARKRAPVAVEPETSYELSVAELLERYGPAAILSAAARITKPRLGEEPLRDAEEIHRFAVRMWPDLIRGGHEFVPVIGLDARLRPIAVWEAARGGLVSAPVDPRNVFATALKKEAMGVVILHGHPSGDPMPSGDDRRLTARIATAGTMIGVDLLDHVIVGDGSYYSLASEGPLA